MNASETVNTKKVIGRRELHFDTFDDLLADAESLTAIQSRTLGNWSYGQILRHLARSIESMMWTFNVSVGTADLKITVRSGSKFHWRIGRRRVAGAEDTTPKDWPSAEIFQIRTPGVARGGNARRR